jgi:cytoskeleton protein RodZ
MSGHEFQVVGWSMVQSGHNSHSRPLPDDGFAIGDILRGERATLGKSLLDVQRDLRIKAAHIAAIENLDPSAFPNPAFISGFVRSYARYLDLDPDEVYARFCRDSGFTPAAKAPLGGADPSGRGAGKRRAFAGAGAPAAGLAARLGDIPFSAIGSLVVMIGLVAGLGYGGWTILQNIQRVQFAPVEDIPLAQAEIAALEPPGAETLAEPAPGDLASPVAATTLADLYRRQEVEVPILMPRDGPIAAIDPERSGLLAGRSRMNADTIGPVPATASVTAPAPTAAAQAPGEPTVAAEPAGLIVPAAALGQVMVVAERAAWVRVYLADKTVIFERILETGETYSPPSDVEAPMIWAGNSGSVYVWVGDRLHGPLGSGTRAVRDVVLEPEAISAAFAVVETIPEPVRASAPQPVERAAFAIE